MKTQNKKLNFNSQTIVELNDSKLNNVRGGSPLTDLIESYIRVKTWGTIIDQGPL